MNISELKTDRPESSIDSLKMKSIEGLRILEMDQESSGKPSHMSSKWTTHLEPEPLLKAWYVTK